MNDPTHQRPRPRGVPDEPDQVPRLLRFREEHPDISIVLAGFWQAIVPAENGEQVVTRYRLKDLLDRLDGLLGGEGTTS